MNLRLIVTIWVLGAHYFTSMRGGCRTVGSFNSLFIIHMSGTRHLFSNVRNPTYNVLLGQVNLAEGAGVNRHRTPKRKDLSNNERSRGAVEQRLAHPGHKSSKRYLARVHVRRRSTALRGSALP